MSQDPKNDINDEPCSISSISDNEILKTFDCSNTPPICDDDEILKTFDCSNTPPICDDNEILKTFSCSTTCPVNNYNTTN